MVFLFFFLLEQVIEVVTTNLNRIIDENFYPVETARRSNMRHRPIGIGVQGLADTFILLGMPFDSPEVTQSAVSTFDANIIQILKPKTLFIMYCRPNS